MVIEELGRQNISIQAVTASYSSSLALSKYSIPEISLGTAMKNGISKCIDGADEVYFNSSDPYVFYPLLIKGHGGALIREKVVWAASPEVIVAVDDSKLSNEITKTIPIEVLPYSLPLTLHLLTSVLAITYSSLKLENSQPYLTDNGNFIIHVQPSEKVNILQLEDLQKQLKTVPGILDTGIFTADLVSKSTIVTVKENICHSYSFSNNMQ